MNEHYEHDKQIIANILKDIDEYKVHIAFVESDGYCPRFGYSIGLYKKFNHPEIIIIGLDSESTGAIINNIKGEIEKGTKFVKTVNYSGFLIDFPIQFVEVKKEHYPDYLGYAGWYNNNSINFPTLQLVWPDRNRKFPWELEFNKNLKFKQPLLDRNTEFKFLEEKNLQVYTSSNVLGGEPIKFVYHDEDGDWQFHSNQFPDLSNSKLVCLDELVKKDRSLNDVYYLNYGESAERKNVGEKWKIFEK